jgi:hypothetical protein
MNKIDIEKFEDKEKKIKWPTFLKIDYKKSFFLLFILVLMIVFTYLKYSSEGYVEWSSIEIILTLPGILLFYIFGITNAYIENPSLTSQYGINPFTISFLILVTVFFIFIWYVIVCLILYIYETIIKKKTN